jgi:hypothetical protein
MKIILLRDEVYPQNRHPLEWFNTFPGGVPVN